MSSFLSSSFNSGCLVWTWRYNAKLLYLHGMNGFDYLIRNYPYKIINLLSVEILSSYAIFHLLINLICLVTLYLKDLPACRYITATCSWYFLFNLIVIILINVLVNRYPMDFSIQYFLSVIKNIYDIFGHNNFILVIPVFNWIFLDLDSKFHSKLFFISLSNLLHQLSFWIIS